MAGDFYTRPQTTTSSSSSSTNSDAVADAALGTPADAAWSGTGSGTLTAIGKALWSKLAGVLTVTINGMLPAGTNRVGDVGTPDLVAIEQPIQNFIPMTVGTAITAQRGVSIVCTVAGNVSLTYKGGATRVIPVNPGVSDIMHAITTINTNGTTATATYLALV